jgi:cytochrome c oxidase subunit II
VRPLGSARTTRRPASAGVRRRRCLIPLVVGLALVALTGCSSQDLPNFGMPNPETNSAQRILFLWQGSWIAALVVGGCVWGLIFYAIIRYRRRSDDLPVQTRYNMPIEILYTVVPFMIVAVLFFYTARDESKITSLTKNPQHVVNVVGIRWSWQFNYADAGTGPQATVTGTTAQPPTLVLPQGERVRFNITSNDVNHSFWVPAFLFKMDAIPGRVNKFEVIPQHTGTFVGKCAELCGDYHSRMLFNVRVVSPDEYRTYVNNLKAGTVS